MLFGYSDRGIGVVRHPHHAVARVILDQIFERDCKLRIVLDDQNPEHPTSLPEVAEILVGFPQNRCSLEMNPVRIPCERN